LGRAPPITRGVAARQGGGGVGFSLEDSKKCGFFLPFWFNGVKVQYRQSARLFLHSSKLGLPHPSTAGECVPPRFRGAYTVYTVHTR
jgi:hypothetical protein